MFTLNDKFKYFKTLERQIITIIKLNYNKDPNLIMIKINKLLIIQKNPYKIWLDQSNLDLNLKRGHLTLSMSEYTSSRGLKKLFKIDIEFFKLIRNRKIDSILKNIK